MNVLDQYLDRVCRSIGGPRSLRQHIRQELREHLLDAMAQHKAAGLSEQAALEKALEEFGKPEEVRSELEATHGHRMMAVVIDKAMQWKERTMRAKWLWMTWAYLALAGVIALEVLFITFNVVFIVPKFQRLMRDRIIDPADIEEHGLSWMLGFLDDLQYVGGHYTTFILLGAAAAYGLFEWRVKSENKPFIRLSALGTAAVGLMVVVVLTTGSLVISFSVGAPGVGRLALRYALLQLNNIDTSINVLEHARAAKNWETMQKQAGRASQALDHLAKAGLALAALASSQTVEELRARVMQASDSLLEVQQAIGAKDLDRLETALQKFETAYRPVSDAAKRQALDLEKEPWP
jgi:hypothetical protein